MPKAPSAGCYEFEDDIKELDKFNLRPKPGHADPIPDEQRAIHFDVYEARNILKLLKSVGAFAKHNTVYEEFSKRIVEAAEVGCVGAAVDVKQAQSALDQIRNDIVRRKGRRLVYRYLAILALWAGAGVVIGFVIFAFGILYPGILIANYGLTIVGAMAGAWLSVAASRNEVSFSAIQDFVDVELEPVIRLFFVGLIAAVVALFIQYRVFSFSIGNLNLAVFTVQANGALLLGVLSGLSERALSIQVIQRTKKLFAA